MLTKAKGSFAWALSIQAGLGKGRFVCHAAVLTSVSRLPTEVVVTGDDVRFHSSTEVHCRCPVLDAPWPDPSYISLSLDGEKYSHNLVSYAIVGDAVGLEAYPKSLQVLLWVRVLCRAVSKETCIFGRERPEAQSQVSSDHRPSPATRCRLPAPVSRF